MANLYEELKRLKIGKSVGWNEFIHTCPNFVKHLEEMEDYETLTEIQKHGFKRTE